MDAREGAFNAFKASGQQLLASRHFASAEIQEKLDSLQGERRNLQQ